MVGHIQTSKLLAIKKISNFREQQQTQTQLEFTLEQSDFDGKDIADLKVFLVCDSYIGCDLQEDLKIKLSS